MDSVTLAQQNRTVCLERTALLMVFLPSRVVNLLKTQITTLSGLVSENVFTFGGTKL